MSRPPNLLALHNTGITQAHFQIVFKLPNSLRTCQQFEILHGHLQTHPTSPPQEILQSGLSKYCSLIDAMMSLAVSACDFSI